MDGGEEEREKDRLSRYQTFLFFIHVLELNTHVLLRR